MGENKKFSSLTKIILMNLIGFISAFIVQYITILITKWLFMDVIGSIPFIPKLLSWPVDFYYYAYTGVMFAAMAASFFACNFFCNLVKSKRNYATLAFGIFNSFYYLISMILIFVQDGFNFSLLLVGIATILGYFFFGLDAENEG